MLDPMPNSHDQTTDSAYIVPRRALWRRIFLPRFSLRSMLVLVTLFGFAAAWVGNWIYRSEQQKRIVAPIHQTNTLRQYYPFQIDVVYDYAYSADAPFQYMAGKRSGVPRFLLEKFGEDYFHNVLALRLYRHQIDQPEYSSILRQLSKLRSLKHLHLEIDENQFASESFDALDQMPNLERLELKLFYQKLTLQEIKRLKNYPQLKKIHFGYRDGDEFDISLLAELKSLEEISFAIRKGPPPTVRFAQTLDRVKRLEITDLSTQKNLNCGIYDRRC